MKTINKDITTVTKGFIVHQTNCFTMGSGLTKSLYLKYPIIKEAHSKFVKSIIVFKWRKGIFNGI